MKKRTHLHVNDLYFILRNEKGIQIPETQMNRELRGCEYHKKYSTQNNEKLFDFCEKEYDIYESYKRDECIYYNRFTKEYFLVKFTDNFIYEILTKDEVKKWVDDKIYEIIGNNERIWKNEDKYKVLVDKNDNSIFELRTKFIY